MRLRLQRHPQAPDRAEHPATHYAILCQHAARDLRLVAKQERAALHVTLDFAIDLDLAFRGHVAGDHQIFADDGRHELAGAWALDIARRTLAERRRFGYWPVRHLGQRIAAHLPFRLLGKHDGTSSTGATLPSRRKESGALPQQKKQSIPQRLSNEFAESRQGPLTKNIVSSAACHEPSPSFL